MIAIPVQSPKYGEKLFFIDGEDFEKVTKYKWHVAHKKDNIFYVITDIFTGGKKSILRLHRLLMNCPDGMVVDHIDGNPLNNIKENLRICTAQENRFNSRTPKNKKYKTPKGIAYHKKDKKYYVNATANGVRYYFGCYNNIDEAVKAYEDNINKYHKEFSRLI